MHFWEHISRPTDLLEEPPGIPNKIPIAKKLGAKIGETKDFRHRRTMRINAGGRKSGRYQAKVPGRLRIRVKSSLIPVFPSTIRVTTIPATLGPRSMIGNMSKPSNLGMASLWMTLGATSKKAPHRKSRKREQSNWLRDGGEGSHREFRCVELWVTQAQVYIRTRNHHARGCGSGNYAAERMTLYC
jgi:hypothetical protein